MQKILFVFCFVLFFSTQVFTDQYQKLADQYCTEASKLDILFFGRS